jgi:hypothetical protein
MLFSKSTALKAILPVAGIALAAGVIGAAAPAQAMPIVIDNMTTPTVPNSPMSLTPSTVGGTGLTTTSGNQILGTLGSGNVTRSVTFTSRRNVASGNAEQSTFKIGGGEAVLALPNKNSGGVTLNYVFSSAYDFKATPIIAFNYSYDTASNLSPVTFTLSLGGNNLAPLTFTAPGILDPDSGNTIGQAKFDFRNVNVSSANSMVLSIAGGTARDITITSPITANAVPVPPSVLATGVGAVIGGLKASRKRKQVAAMA